jgi:hypothetical protein
MQEKDWHKKDKTQHQRALSSKATISVSGRKKERKFTGVNSGQLDAAFRATQAISSVTVRLTSFIQSAVCITTGP